MPSESPVKKRSKKLTREHEVGNSMSTEANSPPKESFKKPDSKAKVFNTGRWTETEHRLFLEGYNMYGWDWKKVQMHVGTRSSTQAWSHAQKVLAKEEGKTLKPIPDEKVSPVQICMEPEDNSPEHPPSEIYNEEPIFSIFKDPSRLK